MAMAPSADVFTSIEPSITTLPRVFKLFFTLIFLYLIYSLLAGIYQIYFSPLRQIPGPKTWIMFPLIRHYNAVRGNFDPKVRKYFEYYDTDALRIAPDEVLFNNAQAWQDIMGHGRTPQMPKAKRGHRKEGSNIIIANDTDHARFRRALSHAFSERALKEQEPLLQRYVDLLVERLNEKADSGEAADMTTLYTFTTFDIIGDLAFGKSFNCLESGSEHWWVSTISNLIVNSAILRVGHEYPIVMKLLQLLSPPSLRKANDKLHKFNRNFVMSRRNNESQKGRKDFMDFMERHQDDADAWSDDEMVINMFILIIAGSETTASLLTGLTWFLLRTPHALRKLTEEIRATFDSPSDITVQAVNTKLPYTVACLTEGLRCFPPVPGTFVRLTMRDEVIAGHFVPQGMCVGVHHSAAYSSERNFKRATDFVPERWMSEATEDPNSEFYHDNRKVHEPFHVGPRNCLGRNLALAEMRLILVRVLWEFDMVLGEGMDDWLSRQKSYAVWCKGPLNVRLRRRSRVEQN